MEREQLREHLDQLEAAIGKSGASTAEKERLASLIDDIERQIDPSVVEEGEPENLSDQVESLMSAFEAEHPTIAGILNRIMVTLSSMGV